MTTLKDHLKDFGKECLAKGEEAADDGSMLEEWLDDKIQDLLLTVRVKLMGDDYDQ